MAGRLVQAVRRRAWLGGILAAGAFVALVSIPAGGGVGGGSAAAAYYYYNGGGTPTQVVLTPATAANVVGTSHTVTATVTDTNGAAVAGIVVRFAVTGSVSASGQCSTDGAGQCSFTYSGPALPASDTISAFADTNGDGAPEGDEPAATAAKDWVQPPSTPGSATGKGQIPTAKFDFDANSAIGSVKGDCLVVDKATGRRVKCTDVTAFVESGNDATFYGDAVDGGVATAYAIHVVDNGEPGRGADTFAIVTGTGYSASGALSKGNLQVR